MARLQDFPRTIRAIGPLQFLKNIWAEIAKDNLFTLAAAVAYAWLFAVFPFLIFLLTLFAYIPAQQKVNAHDQVHDALHRILTDEAAETILKNVDQVLNQPKSGLLGVGIVVALWVASGGMAMTMSTLDSAFDSPTTRPFYIQRPLAILLTIVLITLIILVFILLPIGTAATNWLETSHGATVTQWLDRHHVSEVNLFAFTVARYSISVLLMFLILALLYKFGPNCRQKFSFLNPGAVFTVLVWFVLGEIFRFYIGRFGRYDKTYGALGGVAIVLLCFYLDALVLLIGAEINHEVEVTMRAKVEPAEQK